LHRRRPAHLLRRGGQLTASSWAPDLRLAAATPAYVRPAEPEAACALRAGPCAAASPTASPCAAPSPSSAATGASRSPSSPSSPQHSRCRGSRPHAASPAGGPPPPRRPPRPAAVIAVRVSPQRRASFRRHVPPAIPPLGRHQGAAALNLSR
jgi:hypothetical protein